MHPTFPAHSATGARPSADDSPRTLRGLQEAGGRVSSGPVPASPRHPPIPSPPRMPSTLFSVLPISILTAITPSFRTSTRHPLHITSIHPRIHPLPPSSSKGAVGNNRSSPTAENCTESKIHGYHPVSHFSRPDCSFVHCGCTLLERAPAHATAALSHADWSAYLPRASFNAQIQQMIAGMCSRLWTRLGAHLLFCRQSTWDISSSWEICLSSKCAHCFATLDMKHHLSEPQSPFERAVA